MGRLISFERGLASAWGYLGQLVGLASVGGAGSGGMHAFLCYARQDTAAVDRLQAALEAAGVRVWRDTAQLWPGEDWREKIRQAITGDALAFVACFSRAGLARDKSYQHEELALAADEFRLRRPHVPWLIPVRMDDCEIPDLPLGGGRTLAHLQRADLFGEQREQETTRLVTAITRILGLMIEQDRAAITRTRDDSKITAAHAHGVLSDAGELRYLGAAPAIWSVPARNVDFTG